MALKEYKAKRDFSITPEPPPRVEHSSDERIFVIQEHHASRLHYDFRLEVDGVLKSWAVTKEPSLDPKVRRLAVEVEDHPIAYANFSGDIPAGEYGAGHVEIWDHGVYRNLREGQEHGESMSEGLKSGHLEFELQGERLHGAFALIRMKHERAKPQWLLVKMKDGHARASDNERKRSANSSRQSASERSSRPQVEKMGRKPSAIEYTSTEKVMFPEAGLTKGDLIEYYERIANRLLPHLKNRPMTLERIPAGLTGEKAPHFWQKNTPEHYPHWIPRVELLTEEGEPVDYVLVNDRQTLLYLVNQGTITFHPWMSRISNLDRPDFVLFDLDPGERSFHDAIKVARHLHSIFQKKKTESFVKTSGKSGLHVLVPWKEKGDDAVAREWALEIAAVAAKDLEEIATIERSKRRRQGRLYIDTLQNVRGHHAVPPYVVRATPQATVSTPLRWNELTSDLTPARFTIDSIFRRLGRLKSDPIAGLLE